MFFKFYGGRYCLNNAPWNANWDKDLIPIGKAAFLCVKDAKEL
jgi:hypothetical protein